MPYNRYDAKRVLVATFERLRDREQTAVRDITHPRRPSPCDAAEIAVPLILPASWEGRRGE